MNYFQIIGLGLSAGFALLVLLATLGGRLGRRSGTAWLLLWLAAGTAIARPQLTVVVARALGIDRGADLIFYLAILAMFVGFFFVFVRLRRLDEGLTRVVRHLAIDEATPPARAAAGRSTDERDGT